MHRRAQGVEVDRSVNCAEEHLQQKTSVEQAVDRQDCQESLEKTVN